MNDAAAQSVPGDPVEASGHSGPDGVRAATGLALHLIVPIAIIAVPLILMGIGVVWAQYRTERSRSETQLVDYARALGRQVDQEFARVIVVGETLAHSTALARADWPAFQAEMRATRGLLFQDLPQAAWPRISLRDVAGSMRFNTDGDTPPPGTAVPVQVARALASGRPRISDFYLSARTGTRRVSVAVPVHRAAPEGAVAGPICGILAISVPRERFRAIVEQAELPPGAQVSVHDRTGLMVARSYRDAETTGRFPPPAVLRDILRGEAGVLPSGTVTVDKVAATIAFAHAPASGFIVTVNVPEAVFLAPLRASLLRSAAIGTLVMATGLVLASLAARRVLAAFRRVPAAAAAGAAAGGIIPASLGLREANELASLLAGAQAARDRAAADTHALFDNSPIGIAMVDASGRIQSANDAFLRLIGRTRAAPAAGLRWETVVPPAWHARDRAAIAATLAGEAPEPIEQDCLGPDELRRTVLVSFGATRRGSASVAVFMVDLTERRAAEQALRQSEERWREVVEAAPNAMVIVDCAGTIRRVNRQAEMLFGHARRDMLGQSVELLVPEAARARHRSLRAAYRNDPQVRPPGTVRELQGVRRDGTALPLDINLTPIATGEESLVLVTIVDLTERKRQEAVLRQSEAQLRQAQKMQAIGTLTGGVAHDFNNLLGVIIGNLDLAHPLVDGHQAAAELIGDALDAALRGADLTQRLLAFARRQPLNPRHVALNQLVRDMAPLLARLLGEPIQVTFLLAEDAWPVVADPAQVESALANLAANARDAMPSGGQLRIATSNHHLDAETLPPEQDMAPGDYVLLEMTDTGTGMDPTVVAQIFEPFFTTKRTRTATGLGLSMVFGFMKQSGGHVGVDSRPGVGTTFRLYLPRASDAPVRADEGGAAVPPSATGKTVLVVEDNEALSRVVARQVAGLGYRVLIARHAAEALVRLTEEPVDLLVTDVVMPGEMDGFALARHVRACWPEIGVVLTSGFPETTLPDAGGAAETLRILIKPYRKEHLAEALRAAARWAAAAPDPMW